MRWAVMLMLSAVLSLSLSSNDAWSDDKAQAVMDTWAKRSPSAHVHGFASTYKYDDMFQTEIRGRMEFWIHDRDWRIDLSPGDTSTASGKVGTNGRPYELKTGGYERWVRTDERVMQILGDEPDVHSVNVLHETDPSKSWLNRLVSGFSIQEYDAPLVTSPAYPIWRSFSGSDWWTDLKSDQLPYGWTPSFGTKHSDQHLHLVLTAVTTDETSFSSIEFLLNRKDCAPAATRVSSYSSQFVIVFSQVERQNDSSFLDNASIAWPPRSKPQSSK